MSSPKAEFFAVYNLTTGALLSGQAGSMSFDVYVDTTGASVTTPTITEIGSTGIYTFTPNMPASPTRGLVYVLNTGTNANPAKIFRYVRPEDYTTDNIPDILQATTGAYAIFNSGPDADRLVIYDSDGTTPKFKFDLKDALGIPTATNPATRTRVPGF